MAKKKATPIALKGNAISSKNGKEIKYNRYTGGSYITMKDSAKAYIEALYPQIVQNRAEFLKQLEGKEPPYQIEFKFFRKTKGMFDYINMAQALCDCLTGYAYYPSKSTRNQLHKKALEKERQSMLWLEDDSADYLIPVFVPYEVDPQNPRVEIRVL